jgi:hypothetical protein
VMHDWLQERAAERLADSWEAFPGTVHG